MFCESSKLRDLFIPASVEEIGARYPLYDDTFDECPDLIIHAPKDSYAIDYAVKYKLRFIEE